MKQLETRRTRWRSTDPWTEENERNTHNTLSNESIQARKELANLTNNALLMIMMSGAQAGFFLGIARMMTRGYRIGTTREFVFLSPSDSKRLRSPNKVLRSKLKRWGWKGVLLATDIGEELRECWVSHFAEKTR